MDDERDDDIEDGSEPDGLLYPEAPMNPLEIIRAEGFAALGKHGDNSPEARKIRAMMKSFIRLAGKHVQGPVALEAAERIVAAVALRRRLEKNLIKLGAPASGSSKVDAAQRASYNATINAWRHSMAAFNDAIKMLREPEKKRVMIPLSELVQAMGQKMPIVEVEYETIE